MENHAGEYRSLANFAEEITEQITTIPKNLMYYIDYERMGRDMEMNGDIFTIETSFEEIHVFWNG
jgi:antirestriction protein